MDIKLKKRPWLLRHKAYLIGGALFLGLGLHGGSPWKESNTVNMLGSLIEFLQTTRRVTTECRDGVFVYTKVPGAEQWDIESELLDL